VFAPVSSGHGYQDRSWQEIGCRKKEIRRPRIPVIHYIMEWEEIGLVIAILFMVLVVLSGGAGCQEKDAEQERLRLEALLYRNAWDEAADQAALLIRNPASSAALRRVGRYILCLHRHHGFRVSRAGFPAKTEAACQAVQAFRAFLEGATAAPMEIKARFYLATLLQGRARWRMEVNDVLYAVEIDQDLTRSSCHFHEVVNLITDASHDTGEMRQLKLWARLRCYINFYLHARLYSPGDPRRATNVSNAWKYLKKIAWDHGGTAAGNLATFYWGLTLILYGASGRAEEVFLDIWKTVPWNDRNAPLLEEVLWTLCRLDIEHGRPASVVSRVALLKKRLRSSSSRIPSRFAVLAMGEAVLARMTLEGARVAADTLEADATWLDRIGCPSARIRLPAYAVKLAEAARSVITPESHSKLILLTARGLLEAGTPLETLTWCGRLTRDHRLPFPVRQEAWHMASRAWEARNFLREAVRALQNAGTTGGAQREAKNRLAGMWKKIWERSRSPEDRARYHKARQAVPQPEGRLEYENGMQAYRRDAFEEAHEWLTRVGEKSRYYPLALAFRGYIQYLLLDPDTPDRSRQEGILTLLETLNHLNIGSPNWMPAQSLRYLTQALVKKRMGDLTGALADVHLFENRFKDQSPQVVAEALKVRVCIHLDLDQEELAEVALNVLQGLYPEQRAAMEACLILGRHLRTARSALADPDGNQLPPTTRLRLKKSVSLRRKSARSLKKDFPPLDRYILAADEMTLGCFDQALARLNTLVQERPPQLSRHRHGLELRRIKCLMELGRLEQAETALETMLQEKPNHLKPLVLHAVLLGGTLMQCKEGFQDRPYLDRRVQAKAIWDRIKEYGQKQTPYPAIWFEAQLHLALLNFRAGNPDLVRRIIQWVRVSGYEDLGGEEFAKKFRWLEEHTEK